MNEYTYHSKSTDEVIAALGGDSIQGLSAQEAGERLKTAGPNKLEAQKRKSILSRFLNQLNDILIYVLLVAVVITGFMGEYIDAIIIAAVVSINATLGVIQEVRAGNAIEALRDLATPKALVRREGKVGEIDAEKLVPGDIVLLDAGRYVPADIRLLKSVNLQIEEAALTGESVSAVKDADQVLGDEHTPLGDRVNLAFMSTLVTYGRGEGIVVATGSDTEVGKIAGHLSSGLEVKTPLEIRLAKLGKTLGIGAVAVCIVVFIISFFQGRDIGEMFLISVSLAVASIPEGLAAIVAIVLSIGVTKMAREQAIIKRLPAVETLGSVNIVCSDKTGTLTQNQMEVQEVFTFGEGLQTLSEDGVRGSDVGLLASAMVLASDATLDDGKATGDPTEIGLLKMAGRLGMDSDRIRRDHPRVDELAFDSDRKMMSTLHESSEKESKFVIYAKGAVGNLRSKCKYFIQDDKILPLDEVQLDRLSQAVDDMSNRALRTLAVAFKTSDHRVDHDDFEQDLVLIGVVGMMDPPREEVRGSIEKARQAGITTVMITGDHRNTAVAIAKQLGIATSQEEATTGGEINNLSPEELEAHISQYRVFARVSPEHKVHIVRAFKSQGNIVSMTGDGVNDAPSLHVADIGVAMGITGTDVAKDASDMILADDNFATIISAIEEGRNIYNNIKKSVVFLLSSNLGEVIAMLVAIVIGLPVPLVATQLLWINLVTDTLPAIALGMDPGNPDVMRERPRKAGEHFFSGGAGPRVIRAGVLMGLVTIAAFLYGYHVQDLNPFDDSLPEEAHGYARTLAFLTLIACQLFYALSFRHHIHSVFSSHFFGNPYLLVVIVVGFLLQCLVLYIPFMQEAFRLQAIGIKEWGLVLAMGLLPLLTNELVKWSARRR